MSLFSFLFEHKNNGNKHKHKHEWKYVENYSYLDPTCIINKPYYICVKCGKREK